MSVKKTICVQGISTVSFNDAINTALTETACSIDFIRNLEIVNLSCNILDNKITEYVADTKITFDVDTERIKNEKNRN